jgi:hypothetical protein
MHPAPGLRGRCGPGRSFVVGLVHTDDPARLWTARHTLMVRRAAH